MKLKEGDQVPKMKLKDFQKQQEKRRETERRGK